MFRLSLSLACAAVLFAGCGTPTHPCGTFTFSGTPVGNGGENISDSFSFGPSQCSTTCNCQTICFIQIVRIRDTDTGEYLAPSSQQFDRIVTGQASPALNGWAIDRIDNRVWGYYARDNDGTFASYLTPGSSTSPAILTDGPGGWPDSSWFDAVDVPVCIDSKSQCVDELLGYYYWLYTVGAGGATETPFSEIGVDWNEQAVDLCIAKWNSTAPGVGKNLFPTFTKMQ